MRDPLVITLLILILVLLTPVSAACVLGPGNTIQQVDSNPVTCDYDAAPSIKCVGCTLDGELNAVLNEYDCVINEGDGTCNCDGHVTTGCGFGGTCKQDSGTGSLYCGEACLEDGSVQQRRCDVLDKLTGGSGCIEDVVPYYDGPVDADVACSGGDEDKRLCFYCDLTGKLMADTCLVSDVTGRVFTAVGELQKDCNPNDNPCQPDAANNIVNCDRCLIDEGVVAEQVRCNGQLHKCQQSTDSCYSGNAPLAAACDTDDVTDIDCEFCGNEGNIVTSGCYIENDQASCDESEETGDCLPEPVEGETTFQCGMLEGGTIQCSRCINDVDNARYAIGETRRCVMPAVYGDDITCNPLAGEDVVPIQCYLDPDTDLPPPGAPAIEDACIEDEVSDNGGITCQYCSTSGVARDSRCDVDVGAGSVVCSDEPIPPPEDLEVPEDCVLEDLQWHYLCNDPDDPDDLDECLEMFDAEGEDTFKKNCDRCRLDVEGNSIWRVQRCNYDAGAHTATCDRQDLECGRFSRCSWDEEADAYTDPDHLRLLQFTCSDPGPRCIVDEDEEWDRETCEGVDYVGEWDATFLHCVVPGITDPVDCAGLGYEVEWFDDPLPMCLPDPALTKNLADMFGPNDGDYFGDEPGGTDGEFDPEFDEIFATDDGDNGLYDGTEEVLSRGDNDFQDTLAGDPIFPLYDEDDDDDADNDGDGRIDEDPSNDFGWNDDRDYRDHYCMGGSWYTCVNAQEFEDKTLQVLADAGGNILDPEYLLQKGSYFDNLNATIIAEEIDAGLLGEDGQCCAPEFLDTLEIVTRTIFGTDENPPRFYTCQEMEVPYVIRAPYSDEMNALAPDPVDDPWAPESIDDSPFQQVLAERWGDEGNRTHQCEESSMCIDLDLGMCCPNVEADHCKFCRVFSLTDDLDEPNTNCVATNCFDPDCPGPDCEFEQCQDLDDLADNCFQGCTHALFLPAEDCDETAICEGHMIQPPPFSCCDSVGVEGCSYPYLTDFDIVYGSWAGKPCNTWAHTFTRDSITFKCAHQSGVYAGAALEEIDVSGSTSINIKATISTSLAIDKENYNHLGAYDGDVGCTYGADQVVRCYRNGVEMNGVGANGYDGQSRGYCSVAKDQSAQDCEFDIDVSVIDKITLLYRFGDAWDLEFGTISATLSDVEVCMDGPDAPTSELPADDCCYWLAEQYASAINDGSFPTPYYCLNPEEPDPANNVHTHWCALGKRAGSECSNTKECATFASLPGHGDCEDNVCLGRDLDVFFNDLITYPAPDEDDQCEITENLAQCGIDPDNYLSRALYPPMTPAELECSYEDPENSFAPLADLAISMRENMEQYCTIREPISTSLCNNFFNSIGFSSCLVPVDPVPTLEELDSALIVPLPEEEEEED